MLWYALYAIAVLTLLLHWGKRNAVWGAATLGLLLGVVIALFGDGFDWWTVVKSIAIAALVGTMIEHAPRPSPPVK